MSRKFWRIRYEIPPLRAIYFFESEATDDDDAVAELLKEHPLAVVKKKIRVQAIDTLVELSKEIVGMDVDEARDWAFPLKVRVVVKDGKNCIGTCDVDKGRINVAVVGGKIDSVKGLG